MFGQHDDHANKDNDQPHNDTAVNAVVPDNTAPAGTLNQDWHHPASPVDSTADEPSEDTASAHLAGTGHPDEPLSAPLASDSSTDSLIDIKQQALAKLSPLVGHLDQSPEEKFRTTMMMIQASDDQSKVKTAYEAALEIHDEKARAQALLDVINEINYFTQHTEQ